jgi:hypothetical protein
MVGEHKTFKLFPDTETSFSVIDARDARIDGQVPRGRRAHAFAHGFLDAIRKTHLFNSPWEV